MRKTYLVTLKKAFLAIGIVLLSLPVLANHLYHLSARNEYNNLSIDSSSFPVRKSVSFKSGKYTLQGELLTPERIDRKLPVIIFCVGSGGNSYTSNYTKFLNYMLEQNLPTDSVALFYFNKRGVGGSEGKWYTADFEERASDVKAAADYLATLPFIDSKRIAVVGHSQGGWITQICLSKYPETFVGGISLAGPTFSVREQVQNDYASSLVCKEGIPEVDAWQKALRKTNFSFFAASLLPVNPGLKQLKVIRKFEPAPYLSSVQKPLLLLFGENDPLVSPAYSMAALKKLYPKGTPQNIQAITIEGVNHDFKLSDFCHEGSTKTLPYSEACKKQIRTWAKAFLLN